MGPPKDEGAVRDVTVEVTSVGGSVAVGKSFHRGGIVANWQEDTRLAAPGLAYKTWRARLGEQAGDGSVRDSS